MTELTPWQKYKLSLSEYKTNLGETRPWDFLNPATEYVAPEVSEARFAICKSCPELLKTTQCNLCKCFMTAKTKLAKASCPLHKW